MAGKLNNRQQTWQLKQEVENSQIRPTAQNKDSKLEV